MGDEPTRCATRMFVVLNPQSGSCTVADVREALGRHFDCGEGGCEILEVGQGVDLGAAVREAIGRGCAVVVAAGGDGTVSAVADGVIGTGPEVSLGILPLGTANVLARELGIPVGLEEACRLIAGEHAVVDLDAMEVKGRHYFTQIGVGLDAMMIRDTKHEHKRRFGRIAYLWTAATRLLGVQPLRFSIAVDRTRLRPRASQVLVANSGTLGQPPLRWGVGIRPDDGHVDVCIVRARTAVDYLGLAWHVMRGRQNQSRNVRYVKAEHTIAIQTDRPLPVQADGEVLGETPIEVKVIPRAVRVITPRS